MAYPDKPTGNYTLRDYDFAQADSKKIPMDEYLFKNGYKNAEESDTESVPDAHSQNWLFDILHRNLKYAVDTADENKRILADIKPPVSNVTSGSTNPLTSGGAYTYLVRRASTTTGTGTTTQPVYVKADGQIAICNTMVDTSTNQTIGGVKTFSSKIVLPNNAMNSVGDDVEIGDVNKGGCLGIKGVNGNTGIIFKPYSGSTDQTIITDGAGNLTISGTTNGTFKGNLTGNASSATKATGDKNGLDIAVNYVKRASTTSATGSASQGVYIDASGKVVACNSVASTYSSTSDSPINGKGVLEMLKLIYPVGAIYISTASSCPLASLFGTWQLVAGDRVLQGSGIWSAGANVEQGLPDHTHSVDIGLAVQPFNASAPLGGGNLVAGVTNWRGTDWASAHNSTYSQPQGRVQPPAYIVNIWRRTA